MALSCWEEEEEEEYESLGEEFEEDMNALKRACELTGENYTDIAKEKEGQDEEEDEDDVDDTRFLQEIQNTLMLGSSQVLIPLIKTELEEKQLESYSEEDDADILRAIRRRFAGAASLLDSQTPLISGSHFDESDACRTNSCEDGSKTAISTKHELCNSDPGSRFIDQVMQEDYAASRAIILSETHDDSNVGKLSNGCVDTDSPGLIASSIPKYSGIPGYARALIDALKKNRLCQKTLRNKLIQIERNMEENKELRNRVKCLVDFQNACKRRLRQLLAQDTDSTVKLISYSKTRFSSNKPKEPADIKVAYRCCGPPENEDVAKYRIVQKSFPTIVDNKRWSTKERENLGNGLKQQVQEALVLQAMELSSSQENLEDASLLDEQISAISQREVTAEDIRSFLPRVDWERLASTYVSAHSGADCESRWLNNEDPLINCSPWTKDEEKKLLLIVQKNGLHNWVQISNLLGTNRTPSQCLSRYQRSLNANIMKKDWTEEEDEQLRAVVETFGENDWQIIAANMEGRTGAQCLNRWCKSILPDRKKVGRWTVEEDKLLKVAVVVYGPRMWKKIAAFVPGRTEVQCRERWCNVLDPSIKLEGWTEEEDAKLETAVSIYGYCWSKVAIVVPPRTDNQCRRRWKVLHPQELAAAQKARKIQKAALISNFVGRKKERPTIGPSDFVTEHEGGSCPEANREVSSAKKRMKTHNTVRQDLHDCSKDIPGPDNLDNRRSYSAAMPTATENGELSCPKTDRRLKQRSKKSTTPKETAMKIYDGGRNGLQTLSFNSNGELQSVLDAPSQTEELSLIVGDQVGKVFLQGNSTAKKITGNQRKSWRKTLSVNQNFAGPDLVQNIIPTHSNSESMFNAHFEIAQPQVSFVQGCKSEKVNQTKAKKLTGKQRKSRWKTLSVNQNFDSPDLVQNIIPIQSNSESMFNADFEIAEPHVSSVQACKSEKVKQTKSSRNHGVSGWEQDVHETMQLAIPSVHDGECLQHVRATSNGHSTGVVLDKQVNRGLETPLGPDLVQNIIPIQSNSESMFNADSEIAQPHVSFVQACKSEKVKQTKLSINHRVSDWEQDVHETMQLAIPSVHDGECLQRVRATSNGHSTGIILDKHGDRGLETPFGSTKSNRRAMEKQANKLRDDLVSTQQQKDIERVAHSQSKNPKPLPSNEFSMPEHDTVSHALADQEMTIKGIISNRSEQTDYMQLKRSRRTTRLDINYKELLNGNSCFQTKRK